MIGPFLRLSQLAFFASTLTPLLVTLAHRHLNALRENEPFRFLSSILLRDLALAAILNAVFWVLLSSVKGNLANSSKDQADFIDTLPRRITPLAIASAAAISLFLQLTIIRWQVSTIPLLAFYKNFGLLACFVGLGLGYALARRAEIPLLCVIPLIGLQIAAQMHLKFVLGADMLADVVANPITETVNMGIINVRTNVQRIVVHFSLASIFLLTAISFLPIGQLAGRLMTRLDSNLRAYGYNLLGSLCGVLAMQVLSYFWTPPIVWFGLSFAVILAFVAHKIRPVLYSAVAALATLVLLAWPTGLDVQRVYSPYQLIERDYTEAGLMRIRAAGHTFQTAHNLAREYVENTSDPEIKRQARYYEMLYAGVERLDNVAIVGSGTGNDVAAALRSGAGHVDAVEIDPAVLMLGRRYHPERPYSNPKVTAIVNDARTHFRNTAARYDLIVYGLLDSHTVLGHSSNVRLDSFVYTVEGFREARARLKPGGRISLSFFVLTPELARKIYRMMKEAFDGVPPLALQSIYNNYYAFMQSDSGAVELPADFLATAQFRDITATLEDSRNDVDAATDNWPFFYMPKRVYPYSYLGIIAIFLAITALLQAALMKSMPKPGQSVFFFLGAGFMLIETKGITELGLTFGNTWQVIAAVVSGVLMMAFLANLVVARLGTRRLLVPFILLVVTLAAGYGISVSGGFSSTSSGRIATVLTLTGPLFFSGICFSAALTATRDISRAMAANLLGAMCGGLLEYNAMRFGFQALYLIGIVLYALAALSHFLLQSRGAKPSPS